MNPQDFETPSKAVALAQVTHCAPPHEPKWTLAMLPAEVQLELDRGEGLLADDQPEAAEALYRSLVEKFSAEYGAECRPTWKAKEGLASSLLKRNAAGGGTDPASLREAAAVYEDLLASCRRMAEMGDPTGQCYYGYLHVVGCGVGQDHAVAKQYYELAAAQGYALAFSNLAGLHAQGLGTPVNISKACELYDKAVEAGYVPALAFKALVQEDERSKTALLARGVELGDTTAAFWLAGLHDRRIQMHERVLGPQGVPSDTVAEARRLYGLVAAKPGRYQGAAQATLRQYEEYRLPTPARAMDRVLDVAMGLYEDRYMSLLQGGYRGGLF